jgi:hypothetical protein
MRTVLAIIVSLLFAPAAQAGWICTKSEDLMKTRSNLVCQTVTTTPLKVGSGNPIMMTLAVANPDKPDDLEAIFLLDGVAVFDSFKKFVTIKFGDEEPEDWSAMRGGSQTMRVSLGFAFMQSPSGFYEHLTGNKTLIVEAALYDHGPAQFAFDLNGLDDAVVATRSRAH